MTLAGIELRYLVNDISVRTEDYYLSNIYGITKNSLLFKFHHPEKPDILLMLSTFGIWITNVKIEQIEPNKLLRRLRNDLIRFKLKEIKQIGTERIAYLTKERLQNNQLAFHKLERKTGLSDTGGFTPLMEFWRLVGVILHPILP